MGKKAQGQGGAGPRPDMNMYEYIQPQQEPSWADTYSGGSPGSGMYNNTAMPGQLNYDAAKDPNLRLRQQPAQVAAQPAQPMPAPQMPAMDQVRQMVMALHQQPMQPQQPTAQQTYQQRIGAGSGGLLGNAYKQQFVK